MMTRILLLAVAGLLLLAAPARADFGLPIDMACNDDAGPCADLGNAPVDLAQGAQDIWFYQHDDIPTGVEEDDGHGCAFARSPRTSSGAGAVALLAAALLALRRRVRVAPLTPPRN